MYHRKKFGSHYYSVCVYVSCDLLLYTWRRVATSTSDWKIFTTFEKIYFLRTYIHTFSNRTLCLLTNRLLYRHYIEKIIGMHHHFTDESLDFLLAYSPPHRSAIYCQPGLWSRLKYDSIFYSSGVQLNVHRTRTISDLIRGKLLFS